MNLNLIYSLFVGVWILGIIIYLNSIKKLRIKLSKELEKLRLDIHTERENGKVLRKQWNESPNLLNFDSYFTKIKMEMSEIHFSLVEIMKSV